MIGKIIRTILGLPFAFAMWPFVILIVITGSAVGYIVEGNFDDYDRECFVGTFTLPYQFVKKVWHD